MSEVSVLEEVATRTGGRVTPSPEDPTVDAVVALIDGVEVHASATGGGRRLRVVAPCPGAGDLTLRFYPEGFAQQVGKVFGAQDVEVGESRFDDRYMIKASNESLATLWLDLEVRKLIHAAHPPDAPGAFLVQLEGGEVSIEWGTEDTPVAQRVEQGMRAASALARRPRVLLEQCEAVAEEISGSAPSSGSGLWAPGGDVVIQVPVGELLVTVAHQLAALDARAPELYTRLSIPRLDQVSGAFVLARHDAIRRAIELSGLTELDSVAGVGKDLSFHFWLGAESPGTVSRRLGSAEQRQVVEAMPSAVIATPTEITVWHRGFVRDTVRLGRSLRLLETLAPEPEHREQGSRPPAAFDSTAGSSRRPEPHQAGSRSSARRPQSLWETWQAAGLPGEPGSGRREVKGTVDDVPVFAAERWQSERYILAMRFHGLGAPGLKLRLSEGSLDPLSALFGGQDIEIGDRAFDDRYVIKTNDEGYAKLWLDDEIRATILRTYDAGTPFGYQIEIQGAAVMVARLELERQPERLELMVRAGVALAKRSQTVLALIERQAAALGGAVIGAPHTWVPDGSVSISIQQGRTSTTIDQSQTTTLFRQEMLATRMRRPRQEPGFRAMVCRQDLRAAAGKLLEGRLEELAIEDVNFHVLYWVGCDGDAAFGELFDERVMGQIVLSEPDALVVDEQDVTLWFRGFVRDVGRLERGLKLLDAFARPVKATGPAGPYR